MVCGMVESIFHELTVFVENIFFSFNVSKTVSFSRPYENLVLKKKQILIFDEIDESLKHSNQYFIVIIL